MFQATNSPILRSTFWLYMQLLVHCTDTVADRCHGWDGTCSCFCILLVAYIVVRVMHGHTDMKVTNSFVTRCLWESDIITAELSDTLLRLGIICWTGRRGAFKFCTVVVKNIRVFWDVMPCRLQDGRPLFYFSSLDNLPVIEVQQLLTEVR